MICPHCGNEYVVSLGQLADMIRRCGYAVERIGDCLRVEG